MRGGGATGWPVCEPDAAPGVGARVLSAWCRTAVIGVGSTVVPASCRSTARASRCSSVRNPCRTRAAAVSSSAVRSAWWSTSAGITPRMSFHGNRCVVSHPPAMRCMPTVMESRLTRITGCGHHAPRPHAQSPITTSSRVKGLGWLVMASIAAARTRSQRPAPGRCRTQPWRDRPRGHKAGMSGDTSRRAGTCDGLTSMTRGTGGDRWRGRMAHRAGHHGAEDRRCRRGQGGLPTWDPPGRREPLGVEPALSESGAGPSLMIRRLRVTRRRWRG